MLLNDIDMLNSIHIVAQEISSMVSISKNILEKLAAVKDPELGKDIVSLGMISDIIIKNGNVGFSS